MLERLGASAIYTKVMAKYGRRITDLQYQEMMSLSGVGEISDYLRTHTHYGEALEQLPRATVHRGNLETLLRRKAFEDFAEICRFERSVGEHFFDYILMRGEVTELLRFLRYLAAGHPESYLFAMPEFFNRHVRLDLMALSGVRSYDDLLEVVRGTPYDTVLRPLRPPNGEKFDIGMTNSALLRYQYARVQEILRTRFRGKARRQLQEKFAVQIDFHNIRRIIRGKLYFHESPDLLRTRVIPGGRFVRGSRLDALLSAPTGEEALSLLRTLRGYDAVLSEGAYRNVDHAADKASLRLCRRMIRFSGSPAVVMASYITLRELEINDITSIIEGVRYGLPPEEIAKVLIVYEGG